MRDERAESDGGRDGADERRRVLERHVDHLLGQLHHQVTLLEAARREREGLAARVAGLEEAAAALDEARSRVASLREETIGLREVEVALRRRVDELEIEERRKEAHIERLERELDRHRNRPHRRLLRALRSRLGRREADGRPRAAAPPDPSAPRE